MMLKSTKYSHHWVLEVVVGALVLGRELVRL
jgi:hypothetical protein